MFFNFFKNRNPGRIPVCADECDEAASDRAQVLAARDRHDQRDDVLQHDGRRQEAAGRRERRRDAGQQQRDGGLLDADHGAELKKFIREHTTMFYVFRSVPTSGGRTE